MKAGAILLFGRHMEKLKRLVVTATLVCWCTGAVLPQANSRPGSAPADEKIYTSKEVDKRAKITLFPPPQCTEQAEKNYYSGTITLWLVLRSTGGVTDITVVHGGPNGMTDQCIEAAKKIKFRAAVKDGRQVSQHVRAEYSLNCHW